MKDFYYENGYAVIQNIISPKIISELIKQTKQLEQKYAPNYKKLLCNQGEKGKKKFAHLWYDDVSFFLEDKVVQNVEAFENNEWQKMKEIEGDDMLLGPFNKVGHLFHEFIPFYQRFTYNSTFEQVFRVLKYKNPVVVQSMFIYKNPFISGRVPPHKDSTYQITEPNQTCIGLWFALHDTTIENGCIWGVPGSHKNTNDYFMERIQGEEGAIYNKDPPVYDIEGAIPLEVKRGSVILINGNMIHFSYPNKTEKSRHAFVLHCIDRYKDSQWSQKNWVQRRKDMPFNNYYEKVREIQAQYGNDGFITVQ